MGAILTRVWAVCVLAMGAVFCSAQDLVRDLADLFEDPDNVLWIRTFSGMLDEMHDIEIILGFDGHRYAGKFTCDGMREPLLLTGYGNGRSVDLDEITSDGRLTGRITGTIADGHFNGQWLSPDRSRQFDLHLLNAELVKLRQFRPELQSFEIAFNGEVYTLHLMAEASTRISGILRGAGGTCRVMGACSDEPCQRYALLILDGERAGQKLELLRETRSDGATVYFDGTGPGANATLKGKYPLKHSSGCAYQCLIDASYPMTGSEFFDRWIETWLLEWQEGVRSHCLDNIEPEPSNRWAIRASAWIDIYAFGPQWISGLITAYDVENSSYRSQPFTVGLQDGSQIAIEDLVRDLEGFNTFLSKDFPGLDSTWNAVIMPDGLAIVSDFHIIDGQKGIFLPYERIPQTMIRRSVIRKFGE